MTFNSLSIISLRNKKLLAYYKFNPVGLNLILGQRNTDDDDTNGVGKTALCLTIKYCISEKLPTSFKSKAEIAKNDAHAILEVSTENKFYKIRRSLYNDSVVNVSENKSTDDYSIAGWNTYNKKDFANFISTLIQQHTEISTPSFASVSQFLMRDEKQGYANGIMLPNRQSKLISKCLAFLSNIHYDYEDQLLILKGNVKDLQAQKKQIDVISKDIKTIEKKHKETLNEIIELKKSLDNVSIGEKIDYDQKKYDDLKISVDNLQHQIRQLEFAKKQHEQNLRDLSANLDKAKEFMGLKKFYDQTLKYFPDQLSENYEHMYNFYQAMLKNRGSYFNDQIQKIEKKLKQLYYQQEVYLKELSEITMLIKGSNLVTDLQTISRQINEKQQIIAEYDYKLKIYSTKGSIDKKIKKAKENLDSERKRLNEIFENDSSIIKNIKSHYDKLIDVSCLKPNAITGSIEYTFENSSKLSASMGRIKIDCELSDIDSYGRNNLCTILYDIALLLNRLDYDFGLDFLFHDGPYVQLTSSKTKYKILSYVDEYLKKTGKGQYFVTMNIDEIQDNTPVEAEESITIADYFKDINATVAVLARTDTSEQRCFGFKF